MTTRMPPEPSARVCCSTWQDGPGWAEPGTPLDVAGRGELGHLRTASALSGCQDRSRCLLVSLLPPCLSRRAALSDPPSASDGVHLGEMALDRICRTCD